jgi:hypothetical protein
MTDLGVVDPMRIPGPARARRLWAGFPQLVHVFVALVAADLLARALGLLGMTLHVNLKDPLGTFATFFPHDALILLPALIAWRRPDALEAMPLVTQGAITVALVELLDTPLRGLVSGSQANPFALPTVVAIAATLVTASGWVAIARGMRWFTPWKPQESAAGLANLIGWAFALGAIIGAISSLFAPNVETGVPLWNDLARLNNAVVALGELALAYLAWIIVRGTFDPGRPPGATYLATVAVAGMAVGSILNSVVGEGSLWVLAFFLTHQVAVTALVVAFGLGLVDPSGTIEPAVSTEQPVRA